MKIYALMTSKRAIVIAGIMLAGYLLLILSVANLGQRKLQASHHNELQLKVSHYADILSNYFDLSLRNITVLSKDKTISTFFANQSSGMSMTYGLGASLFNVEKLIKQLRSENKINKMPVYSRITIIALDGTIIADSTTNTIFNRNNIDIAQLKKRAQSILINNDQQQLGIRLSSSVYFQKNPIAIIIAELNNTPIIQQLTAQEYQGSGSRIELSSDDGNLFIWDSLTSKNRQGGADYQDANKHHVYLKEVVKNTPFSLDTWFENVDEQGLFTSGWFVLAISLLAIPVFIGLYFLIRIERNNTLLQTEISHSQKQHAALSLHNFKLEKEIYKRKASEKKLAYQATHDTLTGLANRSYALHRLAHAIDTGQRNNKKVLAMYIDLDNFKQINDTLGHAAGDSILQKTSQRLLSAVRKTDTVARLGGDEFLLIISDLPNQQQATILAVKILSLFEQPFEMDEHPFHTSTSIGLALYPDDGQDPETLLKSADMALYRVKDAGRNNFSFYDVKMNDEVQRKVTINRRLRDAIKNNDLEMYYQPLVDLKTQKIIGAEALMRWTDSELGFVSPEEFIAIAEKNGLIHQIGSFALRQAAQQAAQWQSIAPLQIAINFSSVQFRDPKALLNEIRTVLLETGLPANKLDVEVTESLLINQDKELFDMLKALRNISVQLSIDDFGTGYSALSYLQKFSFTKLKIDRAFIMNLTENRADQSLVTAILAMAKALNLKVVAEGIEEKGQMEFLAQRGCEYGQGYLFSRPVNASAFEKLLREDQIISLQKKIEQRKQAI